MAFRSFASERFWQLYSELPTEVQRLAEKQYELFCEDPFHPSLHLKQVGEVWTARIGRSHRVIGYREGDAFYWGGSAHTRRITSFCGGRSEAAIVGRGPIEVYWPSSSCGGPPIDFR